MEKTRDEELIKEIKWAGQILDYVDTKEHLADLFNYINNLQEEVKEHEMIFDTFSSRPYAHRYLEEKRKELNNHHIIGLDSEMIYKDYYDLKDKLELLRNENERLKELCDTYEEEHNATFKMWARGIKERDELQDRIDNALYYIKGKMKDKKGIIVITDLISILEGKDNESN